MYPRRQKEKDLALNAAVENETYFSPAKKEFIGWQQGDEIHHKNPIDMTVPLTFGLENRNDKHKIIQDFANLGVYLGNNENNLEAVSPRVHKAIHRKLRDLGLEFGPKKVRESDSRWPQAQSFLNKIAEMPYEQRKKIIPEYINIMIQGANEATSDVIRYKDFHNKSPEIVAYARSLQPKLSNPADEEVSDAANKFLSKELDKLIGLIRQESGKDSRVASDDKKTVIVNTQGAPAIIGKAMNGNGNGKN